jgi:hypothetical protein
VLHHPALFCISIDHIIQGVRMIGPIPDRILGSKSLTAFTGNAFREFIVRGH